MGETELHKQWTENYPKAALQAWTRLWIVYNVVLLIYGLIALGTLRLLERQARHDCGALDQAPVLIFGIVANVCFCLGPLVECSIFILLGHRMDRNRYVLFAAGLLFAMLLIYALFMRGYVHISGFMR